MFASLDSAAAFEILRRYNLDPDKTDSVVYQTGGKVYIKSAAVLHMLKDLGGGWKLFYGSIIIPAFIRDFIYNLIAKNRYRLFGRKEHCMIPSDEFRVKFLNAKDSK